MPFPDLNWELFGVLEVALLLSTALYVGGVTWFRRGVRKASVSSPHHPGDGQSLPFISIVIAARNEEPTITSCLEQLTRQTYPSQSYEIIVVDDGSEDATASLVTACERRSHKEHGASVKLLKTEGSAHSGSKKAALGLGIESARGEIIATTDADCHVSETWLRDVADCYTPEVGMVVGFSQIQPPGQLKGLLQGWEGVDFHCLMLGALGSVRMGRPMAASGQNLSFRRQAFIEVGGYSTIRHRVSGDDVLLLQLIRRTGRWNIAFATAKGSFVVHPPAPGISALLSKRTRWASNAPYQLRMDPFFFIYLCATFAMSLLLMATSLLAIAGLMYPLWPFACWTAKLLSEASLVRAGTSLFGRRDLWRYFPLWTLTQPIYLLVVGVLGSVGRFSWKGQQYWWGRQLFAKSH